MYIIKVSEIKSYNLKFTDAYIEEILVNFKIKLAWEILTLILPKNQRQSEDDQTNKLNKFATEFIKIGNADEIKQNQESDQDKKRSSNEEESKEEVKQKYGEDEKEETEQRNSTSNRNKYIESENSKKSSKDK